MDKIIENKINELTKYAFESYSKIDFVDLTDMLNYRTVDFNNVGKDSLEEKYIRHSPGEYECKEIQQYVYAVYLEALDRFKDEYSAWLVDNENNPDDYELFGEYYNHGSGIHVKVYVDSVEFNYTPISTYSSNEDE